MPLDNPASDRTTIIPRARDDTSTFPAIPAEPAVPQQKTPLGRRAAETLLWVCVLATEFVWLGAVVRAALAVWHWY